jgi:hypothetical protein
MLLICPSIGVAAWLERLCYSATLECRVAEFSGAGTSLKPRNHQLNRRAQQLTASHYNPLYPAPGVQRAGANALRSDSVPAFGRVMLQLHDVRIR